MKALSRIVLFAGAVAIGLFLWRSSPRDVTLVYDLQGRPTGRSLEVDISRGGEPVRRAEFRLPDTGARRIEHRLRLALGEYRLIFRIGGDEPAGSSETLERQLLVEEGGTIVLSL